MTPAHASKHLPRYRRVLAKYIAEGNPKAETQASLIRRLEADAQQTTKKKG